MKRVLCVLGTRPEVIKFAPVVRALRQRAGIITTICSTGQHDQMLNEALTDRGIEPDYQRAVMLPGAPLDVLASRLLVALNSVMLEAWPDLMLVQGDTTTALCGALSAFHHGIPVGHVEAGLRTSNLAAPFPEEMNRRLISRLARLHFCPTWRAWDALISEPHEGRAYRTGNTIVDELKRTIEKPVEFAAANRALWRDGVTRAPYVLVTCHRREHLRERLELLVAAVTEIAKRGSNVLWPVHPNPAIAFTIERRLTLDHVYLTPPLSYVEFLAAVRYADAVITDSGGTIEEAVTFRRPLFVIRDETERPEALDAGARLVPMIDMPALPDMIEEALQRPALDGLDETFGDGLAGERIARIIGAWLSQ